MRLLATKKISLTLKDRLIQYGFSLVEHSFIQIKPLSIEINNAQDSLIFTSQNAIKIAFEDTQIRPYIEGKKYFCVGKKTKDFLERNGQKVIKMTHNSSDLARFLTKNCKNDSFTFFCGKRRRPEIDAFFLKNNPTSEIIEIYDTHQTPKVLETTFNGVLFFSPSAVSSFFKVNTWKSETQGFCIGKTTASALKTYTENFSIAKEPNEAQLFISIHSYYKRYHAQK